MCAALAKLRTAVHKVISDDEPKKGDFWNQLAKGFKKVDSEQTLEESAVNDAKKKKEDDEKEKNDNPDDLVVRKEARKKVRKLLTHLDNVYNKPKLNSTDGSDGLRIEDFLDLNHLQRLKHSFETFQPPRERIFDQQRPHVKKYRQTGNLNIHEFKQVLYKVIGTTTNIDEQLEKLFLKLDTACHGFVDWGEFSSYLMAYFKENDRVKNKFELPFRSDPRVRHVVFNHQEPSARILLTESPIRPISVTKTGTILLWDCYLKLEGYLQTQDAPLDLATSPQQRRRFHEWVLDAVYMNNCRKLAMCSSGREIKFFDVASNVIKEEFVLYGMKFVPGILKYYGLREPGGIEGILFCGDDGGNIHRFHFKKPSHQLFDLPPDANHRAVRVWLMDISAHEECVHYDMFESVHSEAVNNLEYLVENRSLVSCSSESNNSVVVYDLSKRTPQYIFRIRRGAECFDLCRSLNILATGSPDHLVRLWNPYVPSKHIALLEGHNNPVLSVQTHSAFCLLFSYSRDGVIKVWDVRVCVCVQTVNMRLPFMVNDKLPDHMYNPFLLNISSNTVYVTASDYILQYRLGKPAEPVPGLILTHKEQLCCAIYNSLFSQVTTASDDSSVITWDIETGNKCLVLTNAHEGEEITSVSYDHTQRRLFTGSRNGKAKVWNFQNGNLMHNLESYGNIEVTGMVALPLLQKILSVGWNKHIILYKDSAPENLNLLADTSWKGGMAHKDDILSCDYCSPDLLATGSYDGEIIVWNVDSEKVVTRLREGYHEKIEKVVCLAQGITPPQSRSSVRSRPNSRHRSHYRPPTRSPAPVDKLLFLKKRAADKRYRESAFLISSEAGCIRFWSVYGHNHQFAAFYGPTLVNECVLGMCTNPDNSLLVIGDTTGHVIGWSITNYCLFQNDECDTQPPVEVTRFKAHEAAAVVSVDLADLEVGTFIITASVDCTAKLYTFGGDIIGTFGQSRPWDLHNRKTWKQTQIDRQLLFQSVDDKVEEEQAKLDAMDGSEKGDANPFVTQSAREDTVLSEDGAAGLSDAQLAVLASNMSPRTETLINISNCQLGIKAEKDFERIRVSRIERRSEFGGVPSARVIPQGTVCSPYTALKTKEFSSLQLADNLPLPPSWSLQKSKTTLLAKPKSRQRQNRNGSPLIVTDKKVRLTPAMNHRSPTRLPAIKDSD